SGPAARPCPPSPRSDRSQTRRRCCRTAHPRHRGRRARRLCTDRPAPARRPFARPRHRWEQRRAGCLCRLRARPRGGTLDAGAGSIVQRMLVLTFLTVTAFHDVAVFDGRDLLPRTTVVVDGDHIVRIGSGPDPAGATIVDGRGKTLLPGLIDAHSHPFGGALK